MVSISSSTLFTPAFAWHCLLCCKRIGAFTEVNCGLPPVERKFPAGGPSVIGSLVYTPGASVGFHASRSESSARCAATLLPNLCDLWPQLTLCTAINSEGAGWPAFSQEENHMADDMEKKSQQGNQAGHSDSQHKEGQHGSQPGQGQQSGQSGQNQPRKGGQGQSEEEDENRDRQRRAS
jgi:hypothetical protein